MVITLPVMVDSLVLHDPATYAHGFPHERFRDLRDHDPVSHHDHPAWERGYWAAVRHADVQRVSRDSETFHNAPHPFLDEAAPLGLVPHLQAQLLARHLRGDLDAYPPWIWK